MPSYALVWHNEAAMTFSSLPKPAQRRLLVLLEDLKAKPFHPGDFEELDATGRANQVTLTGDWLVTYWPDHAVQEIRLMRLESVDD